MIHDELTIVYWCVKLTRHFGRTVSNINCKVKKFFVCKFPIYIKLKYKLRFDNLKYYFPFIYTPLIFRNCVLIVCHFLNILV